MTPDSTLTLEKLYAALDACAIVRWYATSPHVEAGKFLEVKPSDIPQAWNIAPPEYLIFHPDDFPRIRDASPVYVRWKHVREWIATAEPLKPIRYTV